MTTPSQSNLTELGRYIERRRSALGIESQVEFIEHAKRVNGGQAFGRGAFGNWLYQSGIAISNRNVQRLARSLAADHSQVAYQQELNAINDILGRPSEGADDELDVDPELIRQLGPAGRKFIQAQIQAVVKLRRDIYAERDRGDDDVS